MSPSQGLTHDGWRFALASVMGTSHTRSGLPCQDASVCEILALPPGETLIAIAADGAGSASLSHVGSTETCRFVLDRIRTLLISTNNVESISREVAVKIVTDARSNLQNLAQQSCISPRDLACTLLVAIVAPTSAAFFQVGDGALIVGPRSDPGDFSWVFWPERGEYANTTVFISDEAVQDHLMHDLVPGSVDELAVLTDGIQSLVLDYKERSVHTPFFRQMMGPLRVRQETGSISDLSASLATYLDSKRVNERTDDDKTLILASRRLPDGLDEPRTRHE